MPDDAISWRIIGCNDDWALSAPIAVRAAPPEFRLGECRETFVAALSTPDPPDRQVELTNGLTLHYYTETRPHYPRKPGQPVKVCLVNIATYCGSRQVNTRTYLLHQLHDAYRRRPQMLPDTVEPCARER